jgi:hypothetical protein
LTSSLVDQSPVRQLTSTALHSIEKTASLVDSPANYFLD